VLEAISGLLIDPNPKDPLRMEIAELLLSGKADDKAKHDKVR
jgi:hypothetical protein